jgi:HEPN domain-containing protein
MENLFKTKDYHWVLFIGHLVLEKLLKACVVKQTSQSAPFTHDLTKLAKLTGIIFSEEQLDSLDTITAFHLNARYDSYKKAFYRKCTFEYTKEWFDKIEILRQWIKEELTK